jgi:hypothetical protein
MFTAVEAPKATRCMKKRAKIEKVAPQSHQVIENKGKWSAVGKNRQVVENKWSDHTTGSVDLSTKYHLFILQSIPIRSIISYNYISIGRRRASRPSCV